MTPLMLNDAIAAAKRFLKAADAAKARYAADKFKPEWDVPPTREGGAVRRASMDLTRALADLRKTEFQRRKKEPQHGD